jgi:hypothetical protein
MLQITVIIQRICVGFAGNFIVGGDEGGWVDQRDKKNHPREQYP